MSPGKNPAYDFEFDRLRPVGERRVSAGDLAENGASTVNDSALFQPPVCAPRGRAPKGSLDELLARATSSTWGSSEAQQRILEKLGDLGTRFEEGRLRVAVIGQFKRGKSTLLNTLLGAPGGGARR
jgi:hypothetical protein